MKDRDIRVCYEILTHCDDVTDKMEHFCIDYAAWEHDRYSRDSVLMSLGQIGEAVTNFKSSSESGYPPELEDIDWSGIRGMRNVLYHHYRTIDLDAVWKAVNEDVPALRSRLLQDDSIRGFYEMQLAEVRDFNLESELDSLAFLENASSLDTCQSRANPETRQTPEVDDDAR